jgi:hypothetical protein
MPLLLLLNNPKPGSGYQGERPISFVLGFVLGELCWLPVAFTPELEAEAPWAWPLTWDHPARSSANFMGPPGCQLSDHPARRAGSVLSSLVCF